MKTVHVMAVTLMSAWIVNGVKTESVLWKKTYQTVFYVKVTAIKGCYQK